MKSLIFSFVCLLILLTNTAQANLCKSVHDQETDADTRTDNRYYQQFFTDTAYRGDPEYNKMILECNRKRDVKGKKMVNIMTKSEYSDVKAEYAKNNLPERVIRGAYNFFGNIFTQQ